MPVRGLSPGQLFDSLARATGYNGESPGYGGGDLGPGRERFVELFANRDEKPTEAQTSILQALAMMNGSITAGATTLESGDTLAAIAEMPLLDTRGRIAELFLASLTRFPRPKELERLEAYIDGKPTPEERAKGLADVFWALLNTPEFKLNH
jgi:hypothetical protein